VSAASPQRSRPTSSPPPVGVFDSGVGGLTVLHELLVQLPHEDFVYFADAARFPYGERSGGELEAFSLEVARSCSRAGSSCSSSPATRRPRRAARRCASACCRPRSASTCSAWSSRAPCRRWRRPQRPHRRHGHAGDRRQRRLRGRDRGADPFVDVTSIACPDLTEIIEHGFPFDQRVVDTVARLLHAAARGRVDTVILGCTHYPLVRPMLQRFLGRGVEIVSSGAPVARQVEHVLGARGLGSPASSTRALLVPVHGRHRSASTRSARASCSCRSGDVERVASRPARRCAHEPASAAAGRRTRAAADTIEPGFVSTATGSALISAGETRVICTASVEESVPRWMAGRARLADVRVRDAARLHRPAQAARQHARAPGRPHRSRSSA
jgi:glutamate racemase